MLRSWARLRSGLVPFLAPGSGLLAMVATKAVLRRFTHDLNTQSLWMCERENSKDLATPNASWSQEMVHEFNRYLEKTKDGTWRKIPSYRSYYEHFPEGSQRLELQKKGHRMFLRGIGEEGMGFEYAVFLNPLENRIASLFQLGPYLEGPTGFAHGGAIATILDSVLGGVALYVGGITVMTANLNINYKSPVPLYSVILAESRLDKIEGKKIFLSGEVQSVDRQTLHAAATALFLQRSSSIHLQGKAGSM